MTGLDCGFSGDGLAAAWLVQRSCSNSSQEERKTRACQARKVRYAETEVQSTERPVD